MDTVTFNISCPKPLLKTVDSVAKHESRSRSEVIREAMRLYVERSQRWKRIFAFGQSQAKRLDIKPEDVESIIAEYRRSKVRAS